MSVLHTEQALLMLVVVINLWPVVTIVIDDYRVLKCSDLYYKHGYNCNWQLFDYCK